MSIPLDVPGGVRTVWDALGARAGSDGTDLVYTSTSGARVQLSLAHVCARATRLSRELSAQVLEAARQEERTVCSSGALAAQATSLGSTTEVPPVSVAAQSVLIVGDSLTNVRLPPLSLLPKAARKDVQACPRTYLCS